MIRAKLVLRNVISKPLRTIIIVISLAAAAFAALFCIAGISTAQNDLRDFFRSGYGDVDLIIMNGKNSVKVTESDLPEGSRLVGESLTAVKETIPNSRFVNYVNQLSIQVIGIDTSLAYELGMLEQPCPTKDSMTQEEGLTMTLQLAAQLRKKVGDTFTFYGSGGVKYELKILSIVPATKFLNSRQSSILVTPEFANKIAGQREGTVSIAYAAVGGDRVNEAMETLSRKYPDHSYMGTTSLDSDDTMNSMLNIYYLIFAVVFLMVCFIIVSMSKHIVNERMSVIGMLRSVGGSIAGTGGLLLCESAFYGLCGGILGCLLYMPFRGNSALSLFTPVGTEDIAHSDGINFFTILLVILGVTLIQCVFSVAAIVKAAKTPVRDIIFGTKDTACLPSNPVTIAGAVMLAAGVAVHCFTDSFIFSVAAAFLSMIGAVMLFPKLLFLISKGLSALFGRLNMPVAKLASKEISSTKSSVSSAQLLLSAMSLTIAMLVISVSLMKFLDSPVYDCELIIMSPEQKGDVYDYAVGSLDEVEYIEKLYEKHLQQDTQARLNGEERDMLVIALNDGGYRSFSGIRDCPESLADDEIALDKVLASKTGINAGDTVTLGLKIESYLPVEMTFKVKCLIDAGYYNNYGNTAMINLATYKKVYFDYPSTVLIKTRPGAEYDVLSMMRATLSDPATGYMTMDEYSSQQKAYVGGILSVVYAVIVLGIALSLMGTFSNMLMGFEHSRRKYAVFYSSSMSRSKLKRLIVAETLLTGGISVPVSVIFGRFFLEITNKALSMLNMSMPLVTPLLYAVGFGAVAFVLLMIVVFKPIRMLSKMNIAEEIKTSAD